MRRFFYEFLPRLFTKVNLSKVFSIFAVGFGIRVFISYFFDINVFYDYLHPLSLGYYSFMASFVVFINELFTFFNISLFSAEGYFASVRSILRLVVQFFTSFFSLFMNSFNFIRTHFKFEYLKLSFLRSLFQNSSKDLPDFVGGKKEDLFYGTGFTGAEKENIFSNGSSERNINDFILNKGDKSNKGSSNVISSSSGGESSKVGSYKGKEVCYPNSNQGSYQKFDQQVPKSLSVPTNEVGDS
ncbi:hypothetical protein, partial [Streptomyces ziwulingensis]|uniref:hypothetical protein n=1 Tax=Streptomyces ziwulingensis TaxID=1045501 RepID=UPI0031E8446C